MELYYNKSGKLFPIYEKHFAIEKKMQNLIEDNLKEILGLEFVKSEFYVENRRIDTLAYDSCNNSFVIIEYKRERNSSVVDQGVTYLNLVLRHKGECVCELNERLNKKYKRSEIDWSQTRVIFIAKSFTDFQKEASSYKNLPIKLIEVKSFENDILCVNVIKNEKNEISKLEINKDNEIEQVFNEIKVYTEEQHLQKANQGIQELYYAFRTAILALDDEIEVVAKKIYISFKKKKNICDIEIYKNSLKIYVNAKYGTLEDTKHLFTDCSKIGHHGNGDYRAEIHDSKNLEYIMSVVKQIL